MSHELAVGKAIPFLPLHPRPDTRGTLLTYVWAAAIVAAGSLVAEILYRAFDMTRLSMVFLAAVLLTALHLGRGPALFAAVIAFFVYNFYLVEPRFTVQFASADDFLTLVLFLAVAIGTGNLAGQVRDEVVQRRARERTLSTLFEASRLLSATDTQEVLRQRLAEAVSRAAGSYAVVLGDDGAVHAHGDIEDPQGATTIATELSAHVERKPQSDTYRAGLWRARALYADQVSLGAVVWRVDEARGRRRADADGLIDVLVALGAAAIARARLSRVKAEMEAVTRAEQLRTALLSSMSHDFRTPLATILVSATSLLEYDDKLEREVRKDLLLSIQEEVERLNRFVANLLNMTRLESGVLEIRTEPVPVRELIDRVVHRMDRRRGGRRLVQLVEGRDLAAQADPILLEQVLTNITENALAYTPDGSEVTVWAEEIGDTVAIGVADQGDGVPPRELPRIFDKFYRVAGTHSAVQGAGLGLSIAKGLVEAMGGDLKAGGRTDGRTGLSVQLRLPRAALA